MTDDLLALDDVAAHECLPLTLASAKVRMVCERETASHPSCLTLAFCYALVLHGGMTSLALVEHSGVSVEGKGTVACIVPTNG